MPLHSVSINTLNDSRQASSCGESTRTPSTSKIAPWNAMMVTTIPSLLRVPGTRISYGAVGAHRAAGGPGCVVVGPPLGLPVGVHLGLVARQLLLAAGPARGSHI